MVHINDIIPEDVLDKALADKMVAKKTSPEGGKHLYVYTPLAQYRNEWNEATINARGLVTDTDGDVLARPFAKFFNYGDPLLGDLDLSAPVEVTDKMDGSLAIMLPDGSFASKGSFTSFVAEHATEFHEHKYAHLWDPNPRFTYLFEDIFPDNRIVLSYDDVEDLFLLGAVEIETGRIISPNELPEWPGPVTETMPATTLGEALALPPRENAEGVVVRFLDGSDRQVKIKQDDYKALHAIVTNTSPRTLWEHLAIHELLKGGMAPKDIIHNLRVAPDRIQRVQETGDDWEAKASENVPDEFHQWMKDTLDEFREEHLKYMTYVYVEAQLVASMQFESRKDMIAYIRAQDYKVRWNWIVDTISKENLTVPLRVQAAIWQHIKPGAGRLGWFKDAA